MDPSSEQKICAHCGRPMAWRAAWRRSWDSVRYCSDACRRRKGRGHEELARQILALATERGPSRSLCPSEVLPEAARQDKAAMEEVRSVARKLAWAGEVEITQGGRAVDPGDFRGPVRIRRRP